MPSQAPPLPVDQILLITLLVKLAVVATLATMLVRFRWFRRILLTERRDWPERLTFAARPGDCRSPPASVARLLLNYEAADLTLSGAFLAGLIAGPYAGALVGHGCRDAAALRRRARRAALRGRLRIRRRRASRDLPEGRDLAVLALLRHQAPPLGVAARAAIRRSTGRSSWSPRRSCWSCCARRSSSRFPDKLVRSGRRSPAGTGSPCRWRRCSASRSRSRSGTTRASSTGWPSRSSC